MSKMRGVESFAHLWKRRTTVKLPDGTQCDLLSLPDLVQAKKTQRDKDWSMIRRLLEAHYFQHQQEEDAAALKFWLLELRTPQLLLELARKHRDLADRLAARRSLLLHASASHLAKLERALDDEEKRQRTQDKAYWLPLLSELERLRHPK